MNSKVLSWTVAAGAIGGIATNISVFSEPAVWTAFGAASWFKYILTPLLLGALSAGIGVFVLTKTDTTDLVRTFFFAVICGLAFPQIIENAKRTVSGQAANEATARVLEESTQKLQSLAVESIPDPVAINRAAERVRNLSARVESAESRQQAVNALQAAAFTLQEPADKAATIELIKDVGTAAAAKNDWNTAAHALTALTSLETSPEFTPVQGEVERARRELIQRVPEELRFGGDTAAAEHAVAPAAAEAPTGP